MLTNEIVAEADRSGNYDHATGAYFGAEISQTVVERTEVNHTKNVRFCLVYGRDW